jgi:hypothetical protein
VSKHFLHKAATLDAHAKRVSQQYRGRLRALGSKSRIVRVLEFSTADGTAVITRRDITAALDGVPTEPQVPLLILAPEITAEALDHIRQSSAQVITLRFSGDFWTDESYTTIKRVLAAHSGAAALRALLDPKSSETAPPTSSPAGPTDNPPDSTTS